MSPTVLKANRIFCDGACSGNPGPGGWGAILCRQNGQVQELGGGEKNTTNNQMELTGVLVALETLGDSDSPIEIFTDSTYVIRGITQWIWGWKKRGWKTSEGQEVANQSLWEALLRAVTKAGGSKNIKWHYVRGHQGIPGNERCDEIAVAFSKNIRPTLFEGILQNYHHDLFKVPNDTSLPEMSASSFGKKAPAHSYLSLIGTTAERHTNWADCERRVKGQSGAKFKKAMSPEEEQKILREWGVTLKKSP